MKNQKVRGSVPATNSGPKLADVPLGSLESRVAARAMAQARAAQDAKAPTIYGALGATAGHPLEPVQIYDYATRLPIIGDTTVNGTRSAAGPPAAMPSKSDETLLSEAARREEIVVEIELDGGTSTARTRTHSEIEITIPD